VLEFAKELEMKTFLCGLAVLPFLSATALAQPAHDALAQPMQLSESQMDSVTAGFSFLETEVSNTSWTRVSVYEGANTATPNVIACTSCYLLINNPAISVASNFGPVPTL
jgi:hypothetical protein